MILKGKKILIIGASSVIGIEVAKSLSVQGADLILTYNKHVKEIAKLKKMYSEFERKIVFFQLDVTEEDQFKELSSKILKMLGYIDEIIYIAGKNEDNSLLKISQNDWDDVFNVNARGMFFCIKHLSLILSENGNSKILAISSSLSKFCREKQANYCASKAALNTLCQTAGIELAHKQISVNVVFPGFIDSPLNKLDGYKKKQAIKKSLLKKNTRLSDVVNFITFFSSDYIQGISGQSFVLDDRIFFK